MGYVVSSEFLQQIWSSLNEKPKYFDSQRVDKLLGKIGSNGWATLSDVEDILMIGDVRLDRRALSIEEFCRLLGVIIETAYYRPKNISLSTAGFESLRSDNVAKLLIFFERLGFEVDATALVRCILPALQVKGRSLLSDGELSVFWFGKYRHKQAPVILELHNWWKKDSIRKKLTTSTGYKVIAEIDREGMPIRIEVKSPKYRERKDPVNTKCPDCGLQWLKGDPESSAFHRKEHKKRMHYLNPFPLPEMREAVGSAPDYELVTHSSPAWKHREMYLRARAFKREFGYDFIQWYSQTADNDPNVNGYLFVDEEKKIVGACSFRYRKNGEGNRRILDWVWICPSERRKGHLSRRWQGFKDLYGDFDIEPPLSEAMQGFIQKRL